MVSTKVKYFAATPHVEVYDVSLYAFQRRILNSFLCVYVVRRWTHRCDLFHLVNSLDDTLIDTQKWKLKRAHILKLNFVSLLFSVQLTSHMFDSLPSHAVLHTTPTTHLIIMSITRFFLLETPVSFQKIIYIMFKIV